jgi:hypothetical protein
VQRAKEAVWVKCAYGKRARKNGTAAGIAPVSELCYALHSEHQSFQSQRKKADPKTAVTVGSAFFHVRSRHLSGAVQTSFTFGGAGGPRD